MVTCEMIVKLSVLILASPGCNNDQVWQAATEKKQPPV